MQSADITFWNRLVRRIVKFFTTVLHPEGSNWTTPCSGAGQETEGEHRLPVTKTNECGDKKEIDEFKGQYRKRKHF